MNNDLQLQMAHVPVITPEVAFPIPDFPLAVSEVYQFFVYGKHSHCNFTELVLITGGRGEHVINGKQHPLGVGDLLIIPPGVTHGYMNIADLRYYNILFTLHELGLPLHDFAELPGAEQILNTPQSQNAGCCCHLTNQAFEKLRRMAHALHNLLVQQPEGMRFTAKAQLMTMLDFICRNFSDSQNYIAQDNVHRLNKLADELEKNFNQEWSVEKMCHITNLSRPVIFREFQRIYNTTPMDHLLSIRMRKACIMLTQTSKSIGEIALACGFVDSSYFILRFRKRTGMTPKQFRLQSRKRAGT